MHKGGSKAIQKLINEGLREDQMEEIGGVVVADVVRFATNPYSSFMCEALLKKASRSLIDTLTCALVKYVVPIWSTKPGPYILNAAIIFMSPAVKCDLDSKICSMFGKLITHSHANFVVSSALLISPTEALVKTAIDVISQDYLSIFMDQVGAFFVKDIFKYPQFTSFLTELAISKLVELSGHEYGKLTAGCAVVNATDDHWVEILSVLTSGPTLEVLRDNHHSYYVYEKALIRCEDFQRLQFIALFSVQPTSEWLMRLRNKAAALNRTENLRRPRAR